MTAAFAHFRAAAAALAPRAAVVLGSGLGGATARFREHTGVGFGDVPDLVPTAVHGHAGRVAVGTWGGVPVVVFFGRLHGYEGHPADVVAAPVRVAAGLGVGVLILTNAVGGIHPDLNPGDLMAVRSHLMFLKPDGWRHAADGPAPAPCYSPHLVRAMQEHEAAAGRPLLAGVYAAMTGPCYETPAEIRALAACGVDAVGMSTAAEAAVAAGLGLNVAAVSCVTNKAAGLSADTLSHTEVLDRAKTAAGRLGELIQALLRLS